MSLFINCIKLPNLGIVKILCRTNTPMIFHRKQESLFSKTYRPLAQQYFSAGPLPPPLLHPLLGGGSTSVFTSGGGGTLPCWVHFHVHFGGGGGSTSMFTSRGVHLHVHFQGVHYHVHFWGVPFHVHFQGGGGPLVCSLQGGSTSMFTSGEGGSTSVFTSGGVPCDLSHHALIYCYRMPQCIMGKIHMEPPPPVGQIDKTNTSENITFPHYVAGGN